MWLQWMQPINQTGGLRGVKKREGGGGGDEEKIVIRGNFLDWQFPFYIWLHGWIS